MNTFVTIGTVVYMISQTHATLNEPKKEAASKIIGLFVIVSYDGVKLLYFSQLGSLNYVRCQI